MVVGVGRAALQCRAAAQERGVVAHVVQDSVHIARVDVPRVKLPPTHNPARGLGEAASRGTGETLGAHLTTPALPHTRIVATAATASCIALVIHAGAVVRPPEFVIVILHSRGKNGYFRRTLCPGVMVGFNFQSLLCGVLLFFSRGGTEMGPCFARRDTSAQGVPERGSTSTQRGLAERRQRTRSSGGGEPRQTCAHGGGVRRARSGVSRVERGTSSSTLMANTMIMPITRIQRSSEWMSTRPCMWFLV